MSDKPTALEVLVFSRAGFVGSFVFTTPKVSIGRARDAMVRLDDAAVSLKHAVLLLDGGIFRIKDLGSRTGTKVNGAPLLPRQPLEPTDEISIGPFRLRATTCEPEPEEAGPPSETTRRRASSASAGISAPTAQPFFPEEPETATSVAPYSAQPRAREPAPAAKFAREEPIAESYGGFTEPASLGETNETTVVMPSKTTTRPPRNAARAATPAFEPAARPAERAARSSERPGRPSERPARPSDRPARGLGGPDSYSVPASNPYGHGETVPSLEPREPRANIHPDTALDVPLAFAIPESRRDDDDDDDDEDEADFVPSFDLLEALARGGVDDDRARSGRLLSLEIVNYRGDRVLSVRHPRSKGPVKRPGAQEAIGTLEDDATFSVYPEEFTAFHVREGGRTLSTAEALAKSEGARMRVTAGMQVILDLAGDDKFLIHWVPLAQDVAVPPLSLKPSRNSMTEGALSLAVHLGIMLFVGLVVLGEKSQTDADLNAGRFATVTQKELELEPPPPPPPPEKPVVDDAPPTVDNSPIQHDPHAKEVKGPVTKGPHIAGHESASNAASTATTNKLLSALGGAPSAAGAISVTNLDALPAGAGDFKVSGSVGKAPGDSLRVSAGGSGKEVETKTTGELGGSELGKVTAKTSGGAVRARVNGVPQAVRGEGHLDRGEIQKVVNAHLYQIQGCYERQLAKDPSLSGKIAFDWDVGVTGGVSNVRVGRSSVHSVEVTTCIQSAIQGWRFPAPQGGSVTVTYPFAFSSLGG